MLTTLHTTPHKTTQDCNNKKRSFSSELVHVRQPEEHLLTRAGEHHELRVELNALDGVGVVRGEHGHLVAALGAPDVHAAVGRAAQHVLRVGRERRFDRYVLDIGVALNNNNNNIKRAIKMSLLTIQRI